jgi:hypothetical protein
VGEEDLNAQCPYCLEVGSHAVNCWAPHGGPGGGITKPSGRATPTPPGPSYPTDLVGELRDERCCNDRYLRNEAADRIEELEGALQKVLVWEKELIEKVRAVLRSDTP